MVRHAHRGLQESLRNFFGCRWQQAGNIHLECTWDILQDRSHETSLSGFLKTEVTKRIFSDHNRIKLERPVTEGKVESLQIYRKQTTYFQITHGSKEKSKGN